MNGFFHIIRRFRLATALNLLGLTVALAACYVLWTQVEYATNYNRCIDGYEHVFRVEGNGVSKMKASTAICRPACEMFKDVPQVESVFIGNFYSFCNPCKVGDKTFNLNTAKATNDGMRALHPKMIAGVDTFATQRELILPKSIAMTVFGTIDCVGKTMTFGEMGEASIVGVFEDFPDNCLVTNYVYWSMGDENKGVGNNWSYDCIVRAYPDATPESLIEGFKKKYIEACYSNPTAEELKEVEDMLERIQLTCRPLSDTYFSGISPRDKGNRSVVLFLRIACVVLLVVAGINFANFTLAETPMRIKGVNTRKVLGMSDTQLRLSMIGETLLTSLVALCLAVGVIYLLGLWPWMQSLVVGTLAIGENLHIIAYIAAAAVVIGIAVGIYPAFYATSFPPAIVLKGSFGLSPRGQMLRKVLVGVQLTVAFVMAIYIGVLHSQSHYIFSSDYGFDKDEILYSDYCVKKENFESVRAELERIPGVESIGFAQTMPSTQDLYMMWGRGDEERMVSIVVIPCDWKFLRVMGIDIVEGRDFNETDGDVMIVNETTKANHDWIAADKPLVYQCETVIGICKNHRIFTARQDNSQVEMAYIVFGEIYKEWTNPYMAVARVGAGADKRAVKEQLEATLKAVNHAKDDANCEFQFMDEMLQLSYQEEFRFIRQVEVFSLICLLVTLVGVFCLTMFETEYRRKEIGIRKVLGTSTAAVIGIFCRRYTLLIAIAFVVAAPLAYRMAAQWLQNFAERTAIHWWLFPSALIAVTAVVIVTVVLQTLKTAMESPTKAIKTE